MRALPAGGGSALSLSLLAIAALAPACVPHAAPGAADAKGPASCGALPADPAIAHRIAVSSARDGSVSLVDRGSLETLRVIEGTPADLPMQIAVDPRHEAFWVGNYRGGLASIGIAKDAAPRVVTTGGLLAGVAVSPDGCVVAANGARDLTLRLVDTASGRLVARTVLGNAADTPKHRLTQGMTSTHPVWLADGFGVLTEDDVHEEVVLVGRDGTVSARRALRSPIHSILLSRDGRNAFALEEGLADGSVPPSVAVLSIPDLALVREMDVPLPAGEPARLHHGALSPDGETLVVGNMGPLVGEGGGTTVTAFHWRTGDRLWAAPTERNAGHVRFLSPERILVIGHRAAEIAILDAKTGARLESWEVLGAAALGHSIGVEPNGDVTILDATLGQLLRFHAGEKSAESERLGAGEAESSLPE